MATSSKTTDATKKRKRDIIPDNEDDKLEIDVNAPEPPSKKAKRKEKKLAKENSPKNTVLDAREVFDLGENSKKQEQGDAVENEKPKPKANGTSVSAPKRSDYGIWIGNLPFSANRDSIRRFLLNEGSINQNQITRVHMPTAEKGQNKGFAYVDFTTPAVLSLALALSERVLEGRTVLIKNAKSFEGRPEKPAEGAGTPGNGNKKEPNKRIFVGNLGFDITQAELVEHFSQAGEVENVHVATFEDSGKCKGFAWVTFADIEAAKSAVKGFIFKSPEEEEDENDEEDVIDGDDEQNKSKKKRSKAQKWFINRIHGRELRREFAEDAQTRYKKRFANSASRAPVEAGETTAGAEDSVESIAHEAATARESAIADKKRMKKMSKDERQEERRKKHDARMTAPGKALANTPRASAAIVAPAGTRKTFD